MEIHYCFLTRQECNSDHSYIHVICVEHCIAKSIKLYYAYSTLYCIKCIISCIVLNILYTASYCNPHHALYWIIFTERRIVLVMRNTGEVWRRCRIELKRDHYSLRKPLRYGFCIFNRCLCCWHVFLEYIHVSMVYSLLIVLILWSLYTARFVIVKVYLETQPVGLFYLIDLNYFWFTFTNSLWWRKGTEYCEPQRRLRLINNLLNNLHQWYCVKILFNVVPINM